MQGVHDSLGAAGATQYSRPFTQGKSSGNNGDVWSDTEQQTVTEYCQAA